MARPRKGEGLVDKLEATGGFEWLETQIIEGRSMRKIAAEIGVDPASLLRYINGDDERKERWRSAFEAWAQIEGTELLDLVDEPVPLTPFGSLDSAAVNDKRLRVDTRKWLLCKMLPKVFGDKLDLSNNGGKFDGLTEAQLDARLAMLLKEMQKSE